MAYDISGGDFGASSVYGGALSRSQERYQKMMDELKKAEGFATAEVAPEFQQVADIFKTGGEYGAGAKTAIEKAARYGTSQSMANLAQTGMSSGSIAQGVRARYSRQVTEGIQGVEDIRYDKLSNALLALASAKEARGIRASGAYQTTAGLISGWREPTMSESINQEAIAKYQTGVNANVEMAGISAANWRAKMAADTESKTEAARIKATKELTSQQQTFTAGQTKIYEPTAATKTATANKELLYRYL